MLWSLEHYKKYPFTAQPNDFPHLFVEKPIIVVAKSPELSKKVIDLLKTALLEGRIATEILSDHEESLLLYHALLSLLRVIEDKRVLNRIALAYAKTASKLLEEEDENVLFVLGIKLGLRVVKPPTQSTPTLPRIIERGKRVEIELEPLKYALPIDEYVKIVSKRLAHDPSYSLVNVIISCGLVYLDRKTFQRILEEHIFNSIVQFAENIPKVSVNDVNELMNSVKEVITEVYREQLHEPSSESQESSISTPEEARVDARSAESYYPPCIKKIIDVINTGGNPSHLERFTLAAFLGHVGLGVEEILDYFRKTADFNERVARYQVEHILGLRGGKKKYMPYNCENLKAMNICPIGDQCKGGKNPVAIYKYNLRKARGKMTENKQTAHDSRDHEAAGGI